MVDDRFLSKFVAKTWETTVSAPMTDYGRVEAVKLVGLRYYGDKWAVVEAECPDTIPMVLIENINNYAKAGSDLFVSDGELVYGVVKRKDLLILSCKTTGQYWTILYHANEFLKQLAKGV